MSSLDKIINKAAAGAIDRRTFIKSATAAGVSTALASTIWTKTAKAATPNKGGKLTQAIKGGSTTDSLDGATLTDSHNIATSWQIRSCLTEVTSEGEVVGELAESWETTDDASVWTFKLRKGVEFNNAKTVDAEDVIFSINHHRGPDAQSGGSGAVASIADIKSDGKDTAVFELSGGNADFPYLMSDYHLVIAPAGTEGAAWDEGIGTGPFILTDWEPGVRSAAKRNPNYFKEGKPYFDEVENVNVTDVGARANALTSGQFDVIEAPDIKTLHLLSQEPGVTVVEAAGTLHYLYAMRVDTAPFDNIDVREAIKYALDREQILRTLLRGHGYVGNDHPIGKAQKYFAAELPQREHDLDKAKHHMKKAGFDSLDIKINVAEVFEGATDGAILMIEQLKPIGINLEVIREPVDGYWSDVYMKRPFFTDYWSGRATADWMFSTTYAAEANWNVTFWQHERFNNLLREARGELNEAKREEMYAEMQAICRNEGGALIPAFANWIAAHGENIQTPDLIAGNWALDGLRNAEKWWRA